MPVVPPGFGIEDRLLTFAASLLLGGIAIHVGASAVSDARSFAHAVLTALIGAVVWALLEPIPLVGGLLALVAWIGVVKWRYRAGWFRAGAVGVAAWAAAVVALAALDLFGIGSVSAFGVPGT